jgi:hypothetical protein
VSLDHILDRDRLRVWPRLCLTYHLVEYHTKKVRQGNGISYIDVYY